MPRWLLWTLLALFSWGVWAIFIRMIGNALSPVMSQAVSTLGMAPIIVLLGLWKEPKQAGDRRRGIILALAAGVCSCLGNLPFYGALSTEKSAASVVVFASLYPLVTVLLAIPLLKERLNRIQSLGIVISLGAMYLLNLPKEEEGPVRVRFLLLVLIPIALWGVAGLLQKMSTNHLSGVRSAFWFLLAFVPLGAVLAIASDWPAEISGRTWLLSIAVGFTLALGNFAILAAFANGGKASIITPLTGLYPLISLTLIVLWLNEEITRQVQVGALLAITAVVALSWESPPTPETTTTGTTI